MLSVNVIELIMLNQREKKRGKKVHCMTDMYTQGR